MFEIASDDTLWKPLCQMEYKSKCGWNVKLCGSWKKAYFLAKKSELPPPLLHLIDYFMNNKSCLESGSIFKHGSKRDASIKLKKILDKGKKLDLSQITDPHDIASTIKLYLDELPPLVPVEISGKFLHIYENKTEDLAAVSEALSNLPPSNYLAVRLIISMLVKVLEQAESNLMSIEKLARIFCLYIVRYGDEANKNSEMLIYEAYSSPHLTRLFIKNYKLLF